MTTLACVLCGNDRPSEVRTSLARWRDPSISGMFSAIPRCQDRAACRSRCEALGEDWPVIDPDEPSVLPAGFR